MFYHFAILAVHSLNIIPAKASTQLAARELSLGIHSLAEATRHFLSITHPYTISWPVMGLLNSPASLLHSDCLVFIYSVLSHFLSSTFPAMLSTFFLFCHSHA